MKKIIYMLLAAVGVLGTGSCSKEEIFRGGDEKISDASFYKSALNVDVKSEENLVRSVATPDVNDLNVDFYIKGESIPTLSYRYRDMPEVVTLKVVGESSDYIVRAWYGENPVAAWDAPYYAGESEFTVKPNEVASDVAPVVCKLSNIRVSIKFDSALTAVMSSDSKVTVVVGDNGTLEFTKNDEDKSGYFAYVPNTSAGTSSTLAATFTGNVSGAETVQTKTHQDLAPGNHYMITFRLKSADEEDPGNVNGIVTVDSTVQRIDATGNVIPDDDIIEDDSRPQQGNSGNDNPNPPTPPATGDGPEITPSEGVKLDAANNVADVTGKPVEIYIKSTTGITAFKVNISSDNSGFASAVADMLGLNLDMCNPGAAADNLVELGLLSNPSGVRGDKEVTFAVTDFMELLSNFDGTHTFTLTVTDASGTTSKKLIIKV